MLDFAEVVCGSKEGAMNLLEGICLKEDKKAHARGEKTILENMIERARNSKFESKFFEAKLSDYLTSEEMMENLAKIKIKVARYLSHHFFY